MPGDLHSIDSRDPPRFRIGDLDIAQDMLMRCQRFYIGNTSLESQCRVTLRFPTPT